MAKNIIKEIIIILLLALAIILILGVLLYDYVPSNKIIPEAISYTTPENVKTELQTDSNIDDTQVIVTYQIDSTDLNNYKRIQEYVPGKKNPFETIEKKENPNGENETDNTSTTQPEGGSTSTNNTQTNANTSTNTNTGYLPDKGTK